MWQVCDKVGHKANICNFKYDERYRRTPPNQRNSYSLSPTAFKASPNIVSYPTWFADTGASNQVTNINVVNEYTGKEKIMVENGNKLHISHIGIPHIPTLTDKSLVLNKLLHVPEINKNLIIVSQLTFDNHVVWNFTLIIVLLRTSKRGK